MSENEEIEHLDFDPEVFDLGRLPEVLQELLAATLPAVRARIRPASLDLRPRPGTDWIDVLAEGVGLVGRIHRNTLLRDEEGGEGA